MSNPERLVSAGADEKERNNEQALRPENLGDFIGQRKVREQVRILLEAAKGRGVKIGRAHV